MLMAILNWLQNLVTFAHVFECIFMLLNVHQVIEIVEWQAHIQRLAGPGPGIWVVSLDSTFGTPENSLAVFRKLRGAGGKQLP